MSASKYRKKTKKSSDIRKKGEASSGMDDLDLQIFFDDLFFECKTEEKVERLYQKIIDNLDISKEERIEEIEKNN